jgi:hypothetical protein
VGLRPFCDVMFSPPWFAGIYRIRKEAKSNGLASPPKLLKLRPNLAGASLFSLYLEREERSQGSLLRGSGPFFVAAYCRVFSVTGVGLRGVGMRRLALALKVA